MSGCHLARAASSSLSAQKADRVGDLSLRRLHIGRDHVPLGGVAAGVRGSTSRS